MKIPAILLFLLFWSIASCNPADRESRSEDQAISKQANCIESSEDRETLPDSRHRRGLLTEGISNIEKAVKESKVDEEVSVLGITRRGSSENQNEGLVQLLQQKAANVIAGDQTKTAKKDESTVYNFLPKALAVGEEFAHEVAKAIGKVVLRYILKKHVSSITENVPLISNEKGKDMVKNGIDKLKHVTSPLNNVPLISGENDAGDGLKSVLPLLAPKTVDNADELKQTLGTLTSSVKRISSKVGRRERAVADNEDERIQKHGSRKKRSFSNPYVYKTGQTTGSWPRQWQRVNSDLSTGQNGRSHDITDRKSQVSTNRGIDWSRFTLADLLYGSKPQRSEPNTFQTYNNWRKEPDKEDTQPRTLRMNQFSRPSVNTFTHDKGIRSDIDYTDYSRNRLQINSYPWTVRKYGVSHDEGEEKKLNFGTSYVGNAEDQMAHGNTWDRMSLYQPQSEKNREHSNIEIQKNNLGSQRTLYQSAMTPRILKTKNQKSKGAVNNRFRSTATTNKYRIGTVPMIGSNIGETESTKVAGNKLRFESHGGSYDSEFSGTNFYVKPKVISSNQFIRKRYGLKDSDETTDTLKQSYRITGYNQNRQRIVPTSTTKTEKKQSTKKSSEITSNAVTSNTYDVYLNKRIGTGATRTNRLYRYNQAAKSHETAVKKAERNGLAKNGFATWNAQSNDAQSDAGTYNDVSSRGVFFDRGRSTFSNALRKQGGAREHGNPISSVPTKVIRHDRAGSGNSTDVYVSKFNSQHSGTTASMFSKQWQRSQTPKASNTEETEETDNMRTGYRFASKNTQSNRNAQKKSTTTTELNDFQIIPLVLTPMGTATPWSRGHSTIKNQRIYYHPNFEVFNFRDWKQSTDKKSSDDGNDSTDESSSKQNVQPTSGTKSNINVRWQNNNAQNGDVTMDTSDETYNKLPLILTAIPTSKSFTAVRGVKNKRISVEGVPMHFSNRFDEVEYEGDKIRSERTKGNYESSGAASKLINYSKDNRESSSVQTGELYEASASSGAESYEQSHAKSTELSESHVATDKGSRVTNFSHTTTDKGAKYRLLTDKETSYDFRPTSTSTLRRNDATYNGITGGKLSREHKLAEISQPSAIAATSAEVASTDIGSSSVASSNGFAKVTAYDGNTAKGLAALKGSELLTASSAGSKAQGESVEKETSRHKLGKLSGSEVAEESVSRVREERVKDASVTSSMARNANEEEWWFAEWGFVYRKYMAAGYGKAESLRLARQWLADKSSAVNNKVDSVQSVRGSTGETSSTSTSSAAAYTAGSTSGGAANKEAKETKWTMSAKSDSESSAHDKLGRNELHVGKSATGSSAASGVSTGTTEVGDGGKTGHSAEASTKVTNENVRVTSGRTFENDKSASTKSYSGKFETSNGTGAKAESTEDASSVDELSGVASWMRKLRKYELSEKQQSSGINIASGTDASTDAKEETHEESSEWIVGRSRNGWSRWTASETDDKETAQAAKSALSDKSRVESSVYVKLANNEILGKSATEFSGVSVKSGADAESGVAGRYTGIQSDVSLKDSMKVANGIRRANGDAVKQTASALLVNSYSANSIERGIGFSGETSGASSPSGQAFGVEQKSTPVRIGASDVEGINNAHAKELSLPDKLSRSSTHAWSNGEISKHELSINKTSTESTYAFGTADANIDLKSNRGNMKDLNTFKEPTLFDKSSSESFTNAWAHSKSREYGLRSNHASFKPANVFGTAKSDVASNSKSNYIQSLNTGHDNEVNPPSESSSFANAWAHSNTRTYQLPSNKLSNPHAFSMAGANVVAESSTNNEHLNIELDKPSSELSKNIWSQNEIQQRDQSNNLLLTSSGANTDASANERNEYSKHGEWLIEDSSNARSRWSTTSESNTENSSSTYNKGSIIKNNNIQAVNNRRSKQTGYNALDDSDDQEENNYAEKIGIGSSERSHGRYSTKSSSYTQSKANVETLDTGSLKNDVTMRIITAGSAKSGASHESLVKDEGGNEIHGSNLSAKLSSSSTLSAADEYANTELSENRYKWDSSASKILSRATANSELRTNEETETSESARLQDESSAYGKLTNNKLAMENLQENSKRSSSSTLSAADAYDNTELSENRYKWGSSASKTLSRAMTNSELKTNEETETSVRARLQAESSAYGELTNNKLATENLQGDSVRSSSLTLSAADAYANTELSENRYKWDSSASKILSRATANSELRTNEETGTSESGRLQAESLAYSKLTNNKLAMENSQRDSVQSSSSSLTAADAYANTELSENRYKWASGASKILSRTTANSELRTNEETGRSESARLQADSLTYGKLSNKKHAMENLQEDSLASSSLTLSAAGAHTNTESSENRYKWEPIASKILSHTTANSELRSNGETRTSGSAGLQAESSTYGKVTNNKLEMENSQEDSARSSSSTLSAADAYANAELSGNRYKWASSASKILTHATANSELGTNEETGTSGSTKLQAESSAYGKLTNNKLTMENSQKGSVRSSSSTLSAADAYANTELSENQYKWGSSASKILSRATANSGLRANEEIESSKLVRLQDESSAYGKLTNNKLKMENLRGDSVHSSSSTLNAADTHANTELSENRYKWASSASEILSRATEVSELRENEETGTSESVRLQAESAGHGKLTDNKLSTENSQEDSVRSSSSTLNAANAHVNTESSENRYKWESSTPKILSRGTAYSKLRTSEETEISDSARLKAKTLTHGKLIDNKLGMENVQEDSIQSPAVESAANEVNRRHGELNIAAYTASNKLTGADRDSRKYDDSRQSSSASTTGSIASTDARNTLLTPKSNFMESSRTSASSETNAKTEGSSKSNAYSTAFTESRKSSELLTHSGTYGKMYKQMLPPESSSAAFASNTGESANSKMESHEEDRELSNYWSAISAASGKSRPLWSAGGFTSGEALQAKQSPLSAKSHDRESSARGDELGEFNSKKLTTEFSTVPPRSSSNAKSGSAETSAEGSTAKFFLATVADKDRSSRNLLGEIEITSTTKSVGEGAREIGSKRAGGGHSEKLFRDSVIMTDDAMDENDTTRYGDILEKRTEGLGLTKSSDSQYDSFGNNRLNIAPPHENHARADSASTNGNSDAKNVEEVHEEDGNKEIASLFSQAESGTMSRGETYSKGMSYESLSSVASGKAQPASFKSQEERMGQMNEGSYDLHRTNVGTNMKEALINSYSNAQSSANVKNLNMIGNKEWTRAEVDATASKDGLWSSRAINSNAESTKKLLSKTSSSELYGEEKTNLEASSASSVRSSTTASAQGRTKEDIEDSIPLAESRATASTRGFTGNDEVSGKKFSGKLIDASSQVVTGASSRYYEFDEKDTGSVVPNVDGAQDISRRKSTPPTERESSSEFSYKDTGENEFNEDKWGQGLSHSKLIQIPPGKSHSRSVLGELMNIDEMSGSESVSAEATLRKKLSLTQTDMTSSKTQDLIRMRNKLMAGENLSTLSIMRNERDGLELINGKWSKTSDTVLADSRGDIASLDKFSLSTEAGESSESDSNASIRTVGKNKLREREEIDELSNGFTTTAASGKANSGIVSGNVRRDKSTNSELILNSKSSALGEAQVNAIGNRNAKINSLQSTTGESSTKSKASEAYDMLSGNEDSFTNSVQSNGQSLSKLIGSESSSESWNKNAEYHNKESARLLTTDTSMKLVDASSNYGQTQKLNSRLVETLESSNERSGLENRDYRNGREEGTDQESSYNEISTLNGRLSATKSDVKSSGISSAINVAAEGYSEIRDVDAKLAGKSVAASASSSKSTEHSDSSGVRESSSYGSAGAFNMQTASASGVAFGRDSLLSGGAINGRRKFDGSVGTSSKSSAAIGVEEISRETLASGGNAGGDSAVELQASLAERFRSNVGSETIESNYDVSASSEKRNVASESVASPNEGHENAKGRSGYEMWGEWEGQDEWKRKQKWFMERLTNEILHPTEWKENEMEEEMSDERAKEGLMFVTYDSFGRARIQERNVDGNAHVGRSAGESSLDVAGWNNGVLERDTARAGTVSKSSSHELVDGSHRNGKSPHAAVIVPFYESADWWSENGIDTNAGQKNRLSLLQLLGRHEDDSSDDKDGNKGLYNKLMAAGLYDTNGETSSDAKSWQKGRRIELIPITTDSNYDAEYRNSDAGGLTSKNEDKSNDDKKKCIELYTVPPDETSNSSERGTQFIRGLSYEFEHSDTPSIKENNDENYDVPDRKKKAENPKKPYKICLDLDNSDAENDEAADNTQTEIFVVRWTSHGPVRVAKIEDKVKPVVIFKLLSRNTYEKIRDLFTHK